LKLKKINIENFRSYFGENTFEFSIDAKKPITVVIGSNGGGKSSLMNAIQWCFFNKLVSVSKDDKDKPIRHLDCKKNDSYSVEIIIEHDESDYSIDRGWNSSIGDYFNIQPLSKHGDVGKKISNPQSFIHRILPEELKNWFFYTAESTINDLDLSGSKKFKDAMRQIQGFTKVDQLIDDLTLVENRKQREIDKLGKDKKVSEIVERIEELENKKSPLITKNSDLESEIRTQAEAVKNFEDQLINIPKSEPIQNNIKTKESLLKNLGSTLSDLEKNYNLMVGNYLPSLLLEGIIKKRKVENISTPDEIILEYPLGTTLFKKINENKTCICGRKYEPNSPEEKCLNELKKDAISPRFSSRVSDVNTVKSSIEENAKKFQEDFTKLREKIKNIKEQINSENEALESLNKELESLAGQDEKIKKITEHKNEVQKQLDANKAKFAVNYSKIMEYSKEINSLESEKDKNRGNKTKSEAVLKLKQKVDKLLNYAVDKLEKDEKNSLKIILFELNKSLEETAFSHIHAQINPETYEVKTYESNDKDAQIKEMSDGEEELLRYFFVMSILGIASEKTQNQLKYLSNPTSCPLVMDAPFTKMDSDFIDGTVKVMTEKIEQIILFALPKAFVEYENTIKDKIGKAYVIQKADKFDKSKSKTSASKRKIFGKEFEFVKYKNLVNDIPVSQTLIQEVL
jgi:DNA sulfur modification protein DndD